MASEPQPIFDRATLSLLGRVLAFELKPQDLAPTRLELLRGGFASLFQLAAELRLLGALLEQIGIKGLAPPMPRAAMADGRATLPEAIAAMEAQHRAVRAGQARALEDIVRRLNQAGIEPLLIKGARSLWTGSPAWRSLRDLDIVVPRETLSEAEASLLAAGYAFAPDERDRPHHHHSRPLFHHELPGWVELHRAAGNRYAEAFLPNAALLRSAEAVADGRGRVLLLDPLHHLLHALLHHHVGHSGFARGRIDPKGLYEFAADLKALDEAGRCRLQEAAARHPRLVAMLDLWIAAAAALFFLPPPRPFALAPDALQAWERIEARMTQEPSGPKYPGYADEIALASASARLRGQRNGGNPVGRQLKRLRVLASLVPRPSFD